MTHPADKLLFAQIERATAGGRALLCTLGRVGKAFRVDQPARAEMRLLASQAHPVYKGGRLLFDLLELEDLMLDGPQPAPLDQQSMTTALRSTMSAFADLVRVLMEFAREVSPEARTEDAVPGAASAPPTSAEQDNSSVEALPELQASEYLYDLVVLGILSELNRLVAAQETAQPASVPQGPGSEESGTHDPANNEPPAADPQ